MAQSPCFLMKPVRSVVGGQDVLISEKCGAPGPPSETSSLSKARRNDRKTAQ